ncbi:MAG: nuclear transport factor 2 family protein [Saprospiraceae bacterium]|nr:nuclear transport factor 2 family protein [Saprospiraceae bacterium]MCB0626425.1 nuclear transport factor 2 family protein [Saprospiraceae bacterium]MCB0683310.1 nuclear transport factor 2 family protein [Saprospiraceae bacterium]
MTVKQVADRLVELCRQGQFDTAQNELYAEDALSIEPEGAPDREVRGLAAIRKKGEEFNNMTEEVHGITVSDPVVADNFFSIMMDIDMTMKGAGRMNMAEVAVYEVRDGKVVKEQFFYTPMPMG